MGPEESSFLGACDQKENCFKLGVRFSLKTRDGVSLSSHDLKLEVVHPHRILNESQTQKTNAQGTAEFIVEFMQLPTERGLSFLTAFTVSSQDLGSKTFCALVEPHRSKNPVHSFHPCVLTSFQPQIYGEKPTYSFDVSDVVVLDSQNLEGGMRTIFLRATIAAYDLKLREVPVELPVKWALDLQGKRSEGFSKTNARGEFEVDFNFPFSPFRNEQNYLAAYEVRVIGNEEVLDLGFFSLNFERNNIRPLVSRGKVKPLASPTGAIIKSPSDQMQSIDLRPLQFQITSENDGLRLDENLFPISPRSYFFSTQLSLSRARLTQPTEQVALAQAPIEGKIFLIRQGSEGSEVFHEEVLSNSIKLLDGNGGLSVTLNLNIRSFLDNESTWRIFVAVSLPSFDSVPSAYFDLRLREGNQFLVVPIPRVQAEKLLRNRLLSLNDSNPRPIAYQRGKPSDYFAGFSPLSEQISSDKINLNQTPIEFYESLFPGNLKNPENRKILNRFLQIEESFFDIELSNADHLPDSNGKNIVIENQDYLAEELRFSVSGSGTRCISIVASPMHAAKSNLKTLKVFHCESNTSKFSGIPSNWMTLKKLNAPREGFLFYGDLPLNATQDSMKATNLIDHPELFRARSLSRVLFPKAE